MKIFFKYFLLIAILIIGTSSFSQPVKIHGQLKVEGIELLDQYNNKVNLIGVSFGWHNWWPRFYNKDVVSWLVKDWKCNVIRAAMGIEPENAYLMKPEWSKKLIEDVVDAAIENDIYVLIDWHCHNIRLQEAKDFFAEMAQKYGNYPHVIYEIFNEPAKNSWEEVKKYSIEIIETIRKYDSDNIILVGSPHWDQDVHIVADDPITGFKNIMYTLHFYAATHKQELRNRGDYAMSKGIPLFISECAGMEASGDGPINYDEWNKWIDWILQNNLSWITWSIADKDETCSMLKKTASSKGQWTINDLKESGIKTREYILRYAK